MVTCEAQSASHSPSVAYATFRKGQSTVIEQVLFYHLHRAAKIAERI